MQASNVLPDRWKMRMNAEGQKYYVNHEAKITQWFHPGMVSKK